MKEVKVAIVGCGSFNFNTLYPMLRNLGTRLVAVCDIDASKTKKFADFFAVGKTYADYREMISTEKPDAVICAVDAATHCEVAKFCLSLGVSVFVEKTPCLTSRDAKVLAALQEASGKVLAVGFNRRYTTAYMLANDIIHKPAFGKIAMYYSKFNASVYGSNDYFVFNHIIHHLDLARYLLGEITDIKLTKLILSEKSGAFNVSFTASGAVGTIQCASMLEEAYPMERLDIVGSGGNIVVDNLRSLNYNRTAHARDKDFSFPLDGNGDTLAWNLSNGYGIGSGIFSYLGMEAELTEFINTVANEEYHVSCSIKDVIGTMEAMEEVRQQFLQ